MGRGGQSARARAQATVGRRRAVVSFKEEDSDPDGTPIGPITVIDVEKQAADPKVTGMGIPFGYEPEWMDERDWGTLADARALASELGAELEF
jgi:hypothetical protein